MGESYLQRKLFNRLKKTSLPQQNHQLRIRSETCTSIRSQTLNKSIQQPPKHTSRIRTADPEASTRQQVPQSIPNPSPMPSSSSAPLQLSMMIRQPSEAISSPFSSTNNLDDEPPIDLCNQNLSDADGDDDDDDDAESDNQNRLHSPKISRTIATVQSQTTSNSNISKRSRLKSVTNAILFFRKPKSSFGGSTRSTRSSSTSNQSSSNNPLNRQSTNDSSWSQNISSSSPSNLHRNNQGQHHHHNQQQQQLKTSYSGLDLPQFIVPKMNALRLPLVCLIKSLNGELMREVFVHRYELGEYLMENLKVAFGLNDCKYFGLKFAKTFDDQEDLRNNWLDLNESVCKQIKANKSNLIQVNGSSSSNNNNNSNTGGSNATSIRSIEFYLRIKFYPPNLTRVQESFLRNYLWLQLRRDLRLGKLTSSMNNLTLLMACVLQYELGDYAQQQQHNDRIRPPSSGSSLENNHNNNNSQSLEEQTNSSGCGCVGRNYPVEQQIADLNILPNQDLIEEQAVELWRTRLAGMRQYQAQMQFLRAAVILETYGFDYYPVRDHQRQRAYLLGFNYAGIKTIRNGRIAHHFRWHNISKISYERRMIIFHIYPNENSKRKQILGFKCLSNEDCQNLYMRLLEQKYFFTVDLAYFDKSVRRPSYLCETQSDSLLDWSSLATPSTIKNAGSAIAGPSNNARSTSIAVTSETSTQVSHSNAGYSNAAELSNEASFESFNVAEQQTKQQQQQQQQQQQEQSLELELGRQQHQLTLTQQTRPIGQSVVGAVASSSNIFPTSQVSKVAEMEQAPPLLERYSPGGKIADSETNLPSHHYTDAICAQCCPTTSSRPPVNLNVSDVSGHKYEFSKEGSSRNKNNTSLNDGRERNVAATSSSFSSPFIRKTDQASCSAPHITRNILQRQQSTMQYESSVSSFKPQPSFALATSTNLRPFKGGLTETVPNIMKDRFSDDAGGNWTLSGIWSKVPISLKAATSGGDQEQHQGGSENAQNHSSTNYQFFHRLIEFAESVLIEPVASIQQHSHNSDRRRRRRRRAGGGEEGGEERETGNGISVLSSRIILPVIRLCLLILLINFMLRVSDTLSNILIDSFTFGAYQNNPSTTTTATATSHALSHHSDF